MEVGFPRRKVPCCALLFVRCLTEVLQFPFMSNGLLPPLPCPACAPRPSEGFGEQSPSTGAQLTLTHPALSRSPVNEHPGGSTGPPCPGLCLSLWGWYPSVCTGSLRGVGPPVLERRSPNTACCHVPLGVPGGGPHSFFSGGCWRSRGPLACGCITPVPASSVTEPPYLGAAVCDSSSPRRMARRAPRALV